MRETHHETRRTVRDHYAGLAGGAEACRQDACSTPDCCAPSTGPRDLREVARQLGYAEADLDRLPVGETMTFGCGNPVALASLAPGETVLDLGSGAGFDTLLAAERVGPAGRVIGVDMTPAMLDRARAAAAGRPQVEFRLGEIEHLPVADAAVDVVLSNCVINLSPEKAQVFAEAYRVLRPGGRLAVSDTVALRDLAGSPFDGDEHLATCIRGSVSVAALEAMLAAAGFVDVRIAVLEQSAPIIRSWLPDSGLEDYVASALIEARKPD
jgi:SAM-dependent methyltransferase